MCDFHRMGFGLMLFIRREYPVRIHMWTQNVYVHVHWDLGYHSIHPVVIPWTANTYSRERIKTLCSPRIVHGVEVPWVLFDEIQWRHPIEFSPEEVSNRTYKFQSSTPLLHIASFGGDYDSDGSVDTISVMIFSNIDDDVVAAIDDHGGERYSSPV